MDSPPAPRIATIDSVRGLAVMGILLMNIVAFAMPEAAYLNPRAYGGAHGADFATWAVEFVFVDGKMRGLFTVLFGASLLLVTDRADAKGERAWLVHYSRMFWLLLFGLAHLFFVWWGDILHLYAIVGCVAFPFRRLPAAKLAAIAICLVVLQQLWMLVLPFNVHLAVTEVAGGHPSAAAVEAYRTFRNAFGVSTPAAIAADLAAYRGSYAQVYAHRLPEALSIPLTNLWFGWPETLGYMLGGMAALRSGLLTGAWTRSDYVRALRIGWGIGVPAMALIAWYVWYEDFTIQAVTIGSVALTTMPRVLMIAGWVSAILLLLPPGGPLTRRIAAAGRMAFSNYLGTSLVCTTVFYGYGLGWYGQLSRAELVPVVLVVWAIMLLWCEPWLRRFRYGPLEWLWRSLARLRLQPMRGAALSPPGSPDRTGPDPAP